MENLTEMRERHSDLLEEYTDTRDEKRLSELRSEMALLVTSIDISNDDFTPIDEDMWDSYSDLPNPKWYEKEE